MSALESDAPTRVATSPLRVFSSKQGVKIATWEQVMLTSWSRQIGDDALRRASEQLHQLHQQYPGRIGSLTILKRGLSMPNGTSRRTSMALIQNTRGLIRCRALVLQGEGFWASAFRSLMTGLSYVTDGTSCVVSTREVAVAHLSRHLHKDAKWRAGLLEAIEELEAVPFSES